MQMMRWKYSSPRGFSMVSPWAFSHCGPSLTMRVSNARPLWFPRPATVLTTKDTRLSWWDMTFRLIAIDVITSLLHMSYAGSFKWSFQCLSPRPGSVLSIEKELRSIAPLSSKLWPFKEGNHQFGPKIGSDSHFLSTHFQTSIALNEILKQALRRFLWAAQIKFAFDADKLLINCKLCTNFVKSVCKGCSNFEF